MNNIWAICSINNAFLRERARKKKQNMVSSIFSSLVKSCFVLNMEGFPHSNGGTEGRGCRSLYKTVKPRGMIVILASINKTDFFFFLSFHHLYNHWIIIFNNIRIAKSNTALSGFKDLNPSPLLWQCCTVFVLFFSLERNNYGAGNADNT